MKVPIRTITVATSVLWVLLIIFSVSVIYSMKDVRLDVGKPQTTVTPDRELLVSFPIGIVNKGYFSLNDFNVSTEAQDEQKSTIAQGSTFVPVIKPGETLNRTLQMGTNLTDMLRTHQNLVLNDTELQVNATVSMKAGELIALQVSSNLAMPWGAPLCNLTIATPEFTTQIDPNFTNYYTVAVPIAFENHAFFDLNGTVRLNMYNSSSILTGTTEIALEAPQQKSYGADLQLDVPVAGNTGNGRLEVFISTSLFNYGPVVVYYGG
jgi:hypothetical protein